MEFWQQLFLTVLGAMIAAGGSGLAVLRGLAQAEHQRDLRLSALERIDNLDRDHVLEIIAEHEPYGDVFLTHGRVRADGTAEVAALLVQAVQTLDVLEDLARRSSYWDWRALRRDTTRHNTLGLLNQYTAPVARMRGVLLVLSLHQIRLERNLRARGLIARQWSRVTHDRSNAGLVARWIDEKCAAGANMAAANEDRHSIVLG